MARPYRHCPREHGTRISTCFGPLDRFPYAAKRKYTPPESPFEAYVA
jgi:hypothetical protein